MLVSDRSECVSYCITAAAIILLAVVAMLMARKGNVYGGHFTFSHTSLARCSFLSTCPLFFFFCLINSRRDQKKRLLREFLFIAAVM